MFVDPAVTQLSNLKNDQREKEVSTYIGTSSVSTLSHDYSVLGTYPGIHDIEIGRSPTP
jgi:hypothetical protein